MGQVDRMIWWNGRETICLNQLLAMTPELAQLHGIGVTYKETLEMAMLAVKREENAIMTMFSRAVSLVIWK